MTFQTNSFKPASVYFASRGQCWQIHSSLFFHLPIDSFEIKKRKEITRVSISEKKEITKFGEKTFPFLSNIFILLLISWIESIHEFTLLFASFLNLNYFSYRFIYLILLGLLKKSLVNGLYNCNFIFPGY